MSQCLLNSDVARQDRMYSWVKFATCLTVILDLSPLVCKGSEPALFLLRFFGTQQVDLVSSRGPQLQSIFHTDVKVLFLAVLHVHHLHVVHDHPALVVQDVPAQEVLQPQPSDITL